MKTYRLKKGPAFQVTEGPMKGHTFEPGQIYTTIPKGYAKRFLAVGQQKRTKNEVTNEHTTGEA